MSCQIRNLKSRESIDMDKTLLWNNVQVKDQIESCHEEAPLIQEYLGPTVRKNSSMDTIGNQWRQNPLIVALDVESMQDLTGHWIGFYRHNECLKYTSLSRAPTIVISIMDVLSMQDPIGHRQIVKEAVINHFKKNCGLIAMP